MNPESRPSFVELKDLFATFAEDVVKPAVMVRAEAYEKLNSANNVYNDMGFDNDGTQQAL